MNILYGEDLELFSEDIFFFCHIFPRQFRCRVYSQHSRKRDESRERRERISRLPEVQDDERLQMIFSKFSDRHFNIVAVHETRHDLIIICDLFGFCKIPLKNNNACPFHDSCKRIYSNSHSSKFIHKIKSNRKEESFKISLLSPPSHKTC